MRIVKSITKQHRGIYEKEKRIDHRSKRHTLRIGDKTYVYSAYLIDKESENYNQAINILKPYGLENILIEHELIDNHVRLPLTKTTDINKLNKSLPNGINIPLSQKEKECLHKVVDLYDKTIDKKNIVLNKFYEIFDTYPALKKIHDWWDKIPNSLSVTSIGKVLGHANAQKCYPGFPPLD